jgi:hypothetical protein
LKIEQHTLHWKRTAVGPYISPKTGTSAPDAVTTPDILEVDNQFLLFVGAVDRSQERIICIPLTQDDIEVSNSINIPQVCKAIIEPGPHDFDCYHVFDPATVILNNKIYLYYSAIGKGQDQIGLAISDDGNHFDKQETPVLIGRSPEVVLYNGSIFLYYVQEIPKKGVLNFFGIF